MGEWILILTLIGTSGVSIEKANFSTETACLKAADKWRGEVKKVTRDISAICVLSSGTGDPRYIEMAEANKK